MPSTSDYQLPEPDTNITASSPSQYEPPQCRHHRHRRHPVESQRDARARRSDNRRRARHGRDSGSSRYSGTLARGDRGERAALDSWGDAVRHCRGRLSVRALRPRPGSGSSAVPTSGASSGTGSDRWNGANTSVDDRGGVNRRRRRLDRCRRNRRGRDLRRLGRRRVGNARRKLVCRRRVRCGAGLGFAKQAVGWRCRGDVLPALHRCREGRYMKYEG